MSPISPPAPGRRPVRPLQPYDHPIPSGRCAILELPEEVLEQILIKLDLADLSSCFRLCTAINGVMTSSAPINLHHTVMATSMHLNPKAMAAVPDMPHQMPLTSASMLATLRERITRFNNLTPKGSSSVKLAEGEGSLYEYLEGVLLRSIARNPHRNRGVEMAIYDFRIPDEWEDVEGGLDDGAEGVFANHAVSPPPDNTVSSTVTVSNDEAILVAETQILDGWSSDEIETDDDDSDEEWHSAGDDSEADEPFDHGALGPTVINENDPTAMGIRRQTRFDFIIMELAVDPGQDLLVLVSGRPRLHNSNPVLFIYFNLFSLTSLEPHPEASNHILEWPIAISSSRIELDFQIVDDRLFVLMRVRGHREPDTLTAWNWRTGKKLLQMTTSDPTHSSWQSFILLSPSSFVVATMRTVLIPRRRGRNEPDLDFSHHLELYAFPDEEPDEAPYGGTHVATIDLPRFEFNIEQGTAPVRLSARTDPPPRHQFPRYPLHAPPPFAPDPASGIVIIDIDCQEMVMHTNRPHYALIMLKSTLLRYMPAPTSPLLKETWDRPVRVIDFEKLAPYSRLLGPDLPQANWVCYVYHHRYVTVEEQVVSVSGSNPRVIPHLVLYDFDPVRVRKECVDRLNRLPQSVARDTASIEGEVDGVDLVLSENVSEPRARLSTQTVTTGAHLPYIKVSRPLQQGGDHIVPLIDSERIMIVRERSSLVARHGSYGSVQILQF